MSVSSSEEERLGFTMPICTAVMVRVVLVSMVLIVDDGVVCLRGVDDGGESNLTSGWHVHRCDEVVAHEGSGGLADEGPWEVAADA